MGNGGENGKSGKKRRVASSGESDSIISERSFRARVSLLASKNSQEESIPRNGSRGISDAAGDGARSIASDDEGGSDELTE